MKGMTYWVTSKEGDVNYCSSLTPAKLLAEKCIKSKMKEVRIEAYNERHPGTGGTLKYTLVRNPKGKWIKG